MSVRFPDIVSSISGRKAVIPSAVSSRTRHNWKGNRKYFATRAGPAIHVQLMENDMAVDLITAAKLGFAAEDRCPALIAWMKTGEVETIRSDRIVLATGGCGKVYLYTTNPGHCDWRLAWPWHGARALRSPIWSSSSFILRAFLFQ